VRSRCDVCGKGTAFGHNVSHSHHKTNRRWLANIQKATIVVEGYPRKMHVCTRCMRTAQKQAVSQK
jgi:large subunit ribosomal protein L28